MNNLKSFRARALSAATRFLTVSLISFATFLTVAPPVAEAGGWKGIEPLKSRRAEVERALGAPIEDMAGQTGTLVFKIAGGTVKVSFVTAKFVETKKILPELEGTVLQIVLQHENASTSPDTLGLVNNSAFEREERGGVQHFRNTKEGIAYTFVNGKLKTTWYSPAAENLAKLRRKA